MPLPLPYIAVRGSALALATRRFSGARVILAQPDLEEHEQDRAAETDREQDECQQLSGQPWDEGGAERPCEDDDPRGPEGQDARSSAHAFTIARASHAVAAWSTRRARG